jgi:hypothetical protein
MAPWRGEVTAVFQNGAHRSGISPSTTPTWGNALHASFEDHASDWAACHELRVNDEEETWRIVYRIDTDAIVIVEVFSKKTARTPKRTIDLCRKRLKEYDNA